MRGRDRQVRDHPAPGGADRFGRRVRFIAILCVSLQLFVAKQGSAHRDEERNHKNGDHRGRADRGVVPDCIVIGTRTRSVFRSPESPSHRIVVRAVQTPAGTPLRSLQPCQLGHTCDPHLLGILDASHLVGRRSM